ncbi:hypothetical protein A2U01_0094911, partial [Trifolium medium]|nr:hypothetical protein [Trifolium medium]
DARKLELPLFVAQRAGVLAQRAVEALGSWIGSGLGAMCGPGWCNARFGEQVWLWPLSLV